MIGPKIFRGLGVVLAGMVGGAVVIPSSYDEALVFRHNQVFATRARM